MVNSHRLFTTFFLVLILAFAVISCEDNGAGGSSPVTNDGTGGGTANPDSYVTYNGTTYALDKLYVLYSGANTGDGESGYDVDLSIASPGVSADQNGDFSGDGAIAYVDINTSGEFTIDSGTYSSGTARAPLVISYGDLSIGDGQNGYSPVGTDAGSASITRDGEQYTIAFAYRVAADGSSIEGVYKGTITNEYVPAGGELSSSDLTW